jgi:hypothetical protein
MERVTVAAASDVGTGFAMPEDVFAHVLTPLRSADVRFAQVERVYTERGTYQEQSLAPFSRQPPRTARAFKSVPFDVLSIASNHTGDWGPEAVEETIETFRLLGISTIGAGRNIAEARTPAIITCKGLRIAFLGYVSVGLPQSWATETRAGSTPMRAHTYYEPYEFQPGAPARVHTVPHVADLEHLVCDVRKAKQQADLVFVSLHWGVHFTWRPADYQPEVAHAAIDAGASIILGHHPHQPQGIELYKGAVILYSMGNFSFYRLADPTRKHKHSYAPLNGEYTHQQIYSIEPEPGFVFDYRRHASEGGIVYIDADAAGIARVTYLPILMNPAGQAQVVSPDSPQFPASLAYLNWAGKFIVGGMTAIEAAGDRYAVFARSGS